MQIVHVVRQFHPSVGGLENVVAQLAYAQYGKGHDVRVVTLDRIFNAPVSPKLPKWERIGGIEVVRVPYFGSNRYPIALSIMRHIRHADIVHVHGIDFIFDYLAWTAPLHRRKLVVSTHGGFFHTSFAARLKKLYFNVVTRSSLRWYAGVACVSAADQALFSHLRARGACLIENGVDVDKFAGAGSAAPKKTLLAMGRLSSNKRLDRVLAFLAALRRVDPDWSLTIAGRPYDISVDDLTGCAQHLGLTGSVRIVDSPSDENIRTLMADSSAFISASAYEGFGLVAIEAMSAGLWPVLSGIPPFRHLAEQTGVGSIVNFDNVDAAALAFLGAWQKVAAHYDEARYAAMKAAAGYRWEVAGEKYESLYDSALGKESRAILDVPILAKTSTEAVELLDREFSTGRTGIVVFANAHTLNTTVTDRRVQSILKRSIVFNDGVGVDIASRLLFGKPFPENLNGTDFIPHYLRNTAHAYRIYLVGGRPGVAARAAQRLARMAPRHKFVGVSHGFVPGEQMDQLIGDIRRSRADILLVAMGNPHQETWLNARLRETGCRLGFGVGGLFDFMAEVVPRAPQWVRAARLEWIYRMLQQPRRLWRRYLVQMPIFLLRVARQWIGGERVSSPSPQ
ncbi:MAG: WecB/TagA/CpsF family glycosyltransferase [Pseudolabrys sp.]|jgi:alpha-1,3-mannosyltransferase